MLEESKRAPGDPIRAPGIPNWTLTKVDQVTPGKYMLTAQANAA